MLLACGLLLCGLPLALRLISQSTPETTGRTIARTRVVSIPFKGLSSEAGPGEIETLTVSVGGLDEPPEGPAAFDIFDDGGLLIADPLRQRLVIFSAEGKFLREWKIGFAADSLTITPKGLIQVRQANTGEIYFFDREGRPRPAEGAAPPQTGEARLVNGQSGTVARPSPGGGLLTVTFEKPGLRLLSIENLATDPEGNIYVALEAAASGQVVDVSKYVRKYSSDSKLLSEVSDIPLEYYVSPVNELRIRKGILYQMMTTRSEVQMNEWDVN